MKTSRRRFPQPLVESEGARISHSVNVLKIPILNKPQYL